MPKWKKVLIKDFKGLTEIDSPDLIEDNELIRCVNFDVNSQGQLVKRSGLKLWSEGAPFNSSRMRPVFILGFDSIPSRMYCLQADSDVHGTAETAEMYYTTDDSGEFVDISSSNIEHDISGFPTGISYGGKFYYIFDEGFYEFDPNTNANVVRQVHTYKLRSLIEHQDRPFAIRAGEGVASQTGLVYGAPTGWTSGGFTVFIEVKQSDSGLSQIVSYKDKVVIFSAKSINVLHTTGAPSEWALKPMLRGLGANNYGAVCLGDELIYFIDSTGVYRTDLIEVEKVSSQLDSVFKNRLSTLDGWVHKSGYSNNWLNALNTPASVFETRNIRDLIIHYKHKIYCRIVTGVYTLDPRTPSAISAEVHGRSIFKYRWFVFDSLSNVWTEYKFNIPNIIEEPGWDIRVFDSYNYGTISNGIYIVGLGAVGNIHRLTPNDNLFTDQDSPYDSSFRTKNFELGDISKTKRVFGFNTYYRSNSPITISTDADIRLRKIPRTGEFSKLAQSPGFITPKQSFYLEYEDEDNDGPLTVESIELQYKDQADQTVRNQRVHTRK